MSRKVRLNLQFSRNHHCASNRGRFPYFGDFRYIFGRRGKRIQAARLRYQNSTKERLAFYNFNNAKIQSTGYIQQRNLEGKVSDGGH